MGTFEFPTSEIPASTCILNFEVCYHIALQRNWIYLRFHQ